MNVGAAVRSVMVENYATFSGRAPRSEYWWWYLTYSAVATAVGFLGLSLRSVPLLAVWAVITVGGAVPTLAVGSRRLHDIGKSGWAQLVGLVPGIGAIVLLVYLTEDSGPDNTFGARPNCSAA